MVLWSIRGNVRAKWVSLVGALLLLAPTGCGGSGKAADSGGEGKADTPAADVATVSQKSTSPLEQSFLEATVQEPPEGEQRPPDTTRAGKSVGQLFDAVVGKQGQGGLWEQVRFTDASGKKLHYSATIKTSAGTIVMELLDEAAPNHVRNFVALARAGYYDGLSFDRAIEERKNGVSPEVVQYVEAGCPLGTGEVGFGGIGYWLKPELNAKIAHEPGVVWAFWGDDDVEPAACKFYISLNRVTAFDGNLSVFGRITQGLDVVHKIYGSPRATDSTGNEDLDGRLQNPVRIEQVVIHVHEQ